MWSGKALLGVTIWGASFVATRLALESFTAFGLVGVRLLLGAAVLLAAGVATGRRLLPPEGDRRLALLLGLVLGLHTLLQALGLEYTSAISTGWIIGFAPVPIALGGWIFLRQRLTGAGWLGVAVATGGVILIISAATPGFEQARTGDLLQLASCGTWALYTLAGAGAVARAGAFRMTLPATGTAALLMTLSFPVTGILHAPLTSPAIVAALFLGLVCSGLGYLLWYAALKECGAAVAGSYLYLEPFVTVAVSFVFLGEPVGPAVIGGGVLVLLGVYAVARGAGRRPAPAGEPGLPSGDGGGRTDAGTPRSNDGRGLPGSGGAT